MPFISEFSKEDEIVRVGKESSLWTVIALLDFEVFAIAILFRQTDNQNKLAINKIMEARSFKVFWATCLGFIPPEDGNLRIGESFDIGHD